MFCISNSESSSHTSFPRVAALVSIVYICPPEVASSQVILQVFTKIAQSLIFAVQVRSLEFKQIVGKCLFRKHINQGYNITEQWQNSLAGHNLKGFGAVFHILSGVASKCFRQGCSDRIPQSKLTSLHHHKRRILKVTDD